MSQPRHRKSAEEQLLDSYERVARDRLRDRLTGAKHTSTHFVRDHPLAAVAVAGAGAGLVALCIRAPIKIGKIVKPLRFAATTLLAGAVRSAMPSTGND